MKINSRIYVAGHLGLAGSAIYRALKKEATRTLFLVHTQNWNCWRPPK
ncbi:MAG: hypothetical protein CM1200mP28_01170 [Deltaproteobacteria bacterium]|nr:MAG: hypothetical protein CM1200mP28_01170 [Deltaproteobacteria bacterium]